MEFQLPSYVLYCLDTLESYGFEAWCVGGAVRDHIMGKQPFDYDITTNARPEKIIEIFPKTVPTGLQHGTVTVLTDGGSVEITTYRADGEYSDHRSPDTVAFQETVDKDLSRRDFTMNAICYNPKIGFYDPENGIEDIKNGVIRAIGDPIRRFSEDALRIMRAFRFSAQLGFAIEENTKKASISLCGLLQNISVERIYVELKRTLTSKFATRINPLLNCGAFSYLGLALDGLDDSFNSLPTEFAFRISYICKITDTDPMIILGRFKADNVTVNKANIYLALLNMPFPNSKVDLKRMLNIGERFALETVLDYYDTLGKDTKQLREALEEILLNSEPYNIAMLDINGKDLIELGFKGKEIGEKLDLLLEATICDPTLNSKEKLIEKLK